MNAIQLYRISRKLYLHGISVVPDLIKGFTYLVFNTYVPYTAEIGEGSRFAYGGMGCVVHKNAVIGKRVIIGQNTTIGRSLDPEDYPSIGDDVYISAGVRIIGNIHVGNNVIIGANAVVNKNVENDSIVVGVPAKVVRKIDTSIWDMLKNIKFKSVGGVIDRWTLGYSRMWGVTYV